MQYLAGIQIANAGNFFLIEQSDFDRLAAGAHAISHFVTADFQRVRTDRSAVDQVWGKKPIVKVLLNQLRIKG